MGLVEREWMANGTEPREMVYGEDDEVGAKSSVWPSMGKCDLSWWSRDMI